MNSLGSGRSLLNCWCVKSHWDRDLLPPQKNGVLIKKRFTYNNTIKNCMSTYCPDFYIYDWNCYIEVKGYKTELDDIKWEQFKESLQIWDKNKLLSLGISIY